MSAKERSGYCRERGESIKHACSYSTIAAGGEFLKHKDSTTTTLTSTDEKPGEESTPGEPGWLIAARAAESKKATDIKVLDLRGVTTFADYFLICTGTSSRQMQAITDEITLRMKKNGERVISVEGYDQGEWILSDFSDLIVHVFSEKARAFYDLDRLWRLAKTVEIPPE